MITMEVTNEQKITWEFHESEYTHVTVIRVSWFLNYDDWASAELRCRRLRAFKISTSVALQCDIVDTVSEIEGRIPSKLAMDVGSYVDSSKLVAV